MCRHDLPEYARPRVGLVQADPPKAPLWPRPRARSNWPWPARSWLTDPATGPILSIIMHIVDYGVCMRHVTYDAGHGARVGMVDDGQVVDLGFDGSMVEFIAAGAPRGTYRGPADFPRLLAPLRPRSMRDFLPFRGHLDRAFKRLHRPIPDEFWTVPAYDRRCLTRSSGPATRSRGPPTPIGSTMNSNWPEERAAVTELQPEVATLNPCSSRPRGRS